MPTRPQLRHDRASRMPGLTGRIVLALVFGAILGGSASYAEQPKPAIRPVAAKPAALAPPAEAATVPGAPEQSSLGGAWKVNWIRLNKITSLNIAGEKPQPGVVGFDSLIGNLAGADCKGTGFAARTLGGVFPAGGEVNMVGVADYVRFTTQCPSGQIWVEALGVAGKPVQWVGRAVLIDAAGARSFESVVLTR